LLRQAPKVFFKAEELLRKTFEKLGVVAQLLSFKDFFQDRKVLGEKL